MDRALIHPPRLRGGREPRCPRGAVTMVQILRVRLLKEHRDGTENTTRKSRF